MNEEWALDRGRRRPRLDRPGTVGLDRGGEAGGWRMGLVGAQLWSWLWSPRIRSNFCLRRGQYRSQIHQYGVLAGGRRCRVR
jgi:hypothetical protein